MTDAERIATLNALAEKLERENASLRAQLAQCPYVEATAPLSWGENGTITVGRDGYWAQQQVHAGGRR